jgi:pyruvate/2-oxoglutarate dehydrogenase complex dihydrolipoamide dehydrogenase (E3) component
MRQGERFEILILGSGEAGKLLAWHIGRLGRRTAVVERRWIGGSCPNIACMPSKNEIRSAEVAHLARHAAAFIAASQFNQHKQETPDVRVLFTPY